MKEHINHTNLTYSCGIGSANLNIRTGRISAFIPASGIGDGIFDIPLSHIYNPGMKSEVSFSLNQSWKLNVEEQLIFHSGSTHREAKYSYIDGGGNEHEFIYLRDNGSVFQYYDTTGLNQILFVTVANGNRTSLLIEDTAKNKKHFNINGRITQIESYAGSRTNFIYDGQGLSERLIEIFDSLNPALRIKFSYNDNNFLTKIDYVSSNITIQSCFYSYDINKNLTAIRKRAGTLAELVAYFTYNERSQLIDFVDCKDYSALVFNYENISSEDIFKASSITSGVVNIETIKSGIIKIGDVMDVPFFGKLTFVNESETNKNTILYQALNHRTVVTNSEGVVVVYFYNERGFTTSILEAHNGDLNDLRTLEKTPGVSIQDYGNSGETINGRSRIIWQGDSPLYIHGATEFQRLYNYRRNKYPVLVNYTISFWLRQPRKFDNPQIQVQIQSNDVRTEVDTAYAKFDNSAYGWQFIQVPIRISHKNIDWIRLNLVGMERESVHITDMRIEKSPKQTFYIATDNSNQNNWMALDEVVSVSYTGPNPDTNTIGSDFYISEADLEMTYLSYFEARDNNAIGDNFILSACDNTKKIEVNSVNFSNGTRSLNVSFVADAYGGNTRAGYRNVMESPDGNLTTEGRAYFIRSQVIDNVTVDCICQRTTATRGNNISNTQVFYDLKGNKRLETDEANVQTIYHYDSNFILNKRIIQSATGERIISEATTSSNLRTEKHPTSEIKVEKSSPFGIVERTSYNGLGEKGIPLVTSIEYDEFEERIRSVCNNVDGKNSLKFNVRGQLESVSPLDVSNNVMYSHEFEYDIDNRPFRSFFVGSRGRVLISEKIVNKAERRITTREFRTSGNASDADTTIVSMDKYGSTSEINENGNVTTFQKQGSTINNSYTLDGASMGAAEVTSMFDPFENRTYVYSYDEANDPTGYQIRAGNNLAGAEHFSVRTIGSNEVEYRGVTHFESKTETRYHQNRLLEPLVEKTIITDTHANRLPNGHLLNTSERLTQETLYNYDNLDRIAEKRTRIPGGFDTWLNETNSYKPNSFLLEKTEIELRNPTVFTTNTNYELKYDYDQRGNLASMDLERIRGDNRRSSYNIFNYDVSNRLQSESGPLITASRRYSYNCDGSLDTETEGSGDNQRRRDYKYNSGRLMSIEHENNRVSNFNYDRIGNCTHYLSTNANMVWRRGNLLQSYTAAGPSRNQTANYSYSNQGTRFRKEVAGRVTNYFYDGGKLLGERLPDGRTLRYNYDIDGIKGLTIIDAQSTEFNRYQYVKDVMGNVVAIISDDREVAFYNYDGFGNCQVFDRDGNLTTDPNHIGNLNPIRWKSLYYDQESDLIFINGRYYSPFMRRYISADSSETALQNAGVIYGLNLYSLTVENPVNLVYNGYTTETNANLVYDPDELTRWQHFWRISFPAFWRSWWGRGLAIGIFSIVTVAVIIASFIFGPGVWIPYLKGVGVASAFFFGIAAWNGYQSHRRGGNFWETFKNHVNDNWAMSLAFAGLILAPMVGMKIAKMAKAMAAKKQPLASSNNQYSDDFLKWLNKGESDHSVYKGISSANERVYTGITKQDIAKRLYQHNFPGGNKVGKNFARLDVRYEALTKNQARAIEQVMIEQSKGLNIRMSIGKKNRFYEEAVRWARNFTGG